MVSLSISEENFFSSSRVNNKGVSSVIPWSIKDLLAVCITFEGLVSELDGLDSLDVAVVGMSTFVVRIASSFI